MKIVLILTIGTRDVRLMNNYEEFVDEVIHVDTRGKELLELISARYDGKIIADNLVVYSDYLQLPIATPAVRYVLEKEKKIDKIFFVVTDQSEVKPKVEEHHSKRDTMHLASIIEYGIKKIFSQLADTKFETMPLGKGILEYDIMYEEFEATFNDGFLNVPQDSKVYIQPQGGIDAINFPLLLRCIERYPNTKHLFKPEDQVDSAELSFPDLFVQNLKKHKIINALQSYDYSAIVTLDHSEELTRFARFAYHLTALNFEVVRDIIHEFMKDSTDEKQHFIDFENKVNRLMRDKNEHIGHLYLVAKIRYHQNAYDDFLVKMFTVNEQILIPPLERKLGGEIVYSPLTKHRDWNVLIDNYSGLKTYLKGKTHNGRRLGYWSPNRIAYSYIYGYVFPQKDALLINLQGRLEKLALLRHDTVHSLIFVDKQLIINSLSNNATESDLENLLNLADQYFNINEHGIFDEINAFILDYFLKCSSNKN
mgnify:CR=1 FL=1